MAAKFSSLVSRFGTMCRISAVALIAGVCRSRSIRDIDAAITARPVQQQAAITAGVLGALFGLSLIAAQFGWVGMLLFWLAVIVLVN